MKSQAPDSSQAAQSNLSGLRLQRGIEAFKAGRLEEAERILNKILARNPDEVDALLLKGLLAARQGRMAEAEVWLRRCIGVAPDHGVAHDNLGNALMAQGRPTEAEACHREALRLTPSYGPAWKNLAHCLSAQGRHQEAEETLRRAREPSRYNLAAQIVKQRSICDWDQWALRVPAIVKRIKEGDGGVIAPFSAFHLPGLNPADLQRVARAYGEQYRDWMKLGPLWAKGERRPHDRLRIGYLSGDLREHATALLTAGVFESHDRDHFEIYAYSLRPLDQSPMGKRLRAAFDFCIDVHELPPADAAARIRADDIDILVDMHGYTRFSRPEIPAQRPAPLQVSWLGFPCTMGVPFIDYLIVDEILVPPEEASYYDESLAYLPDCYQPQDSRRKSAKPPTRSQAGLATDKFIFCCFNNPYKYTPEMFDRWCGLLRDLPHTLLWLLAFDADTQRNLLREAARRGIASHRLVFAERLPQEEHLARISLADLFLDTLPCTAHTTASDALWAGLPVLTCPGETFPSRVAASVLAAAGLQELIARDLDDYMRIARSLASDQVALRNIKNRLQENRVKAPLFDTPRYTRGLENLYQRIWARHQNGSPPTLLPAP